MILPSGAVDVPRRLLRLHSKIDVAAERATRDDNLNRSGNGTAASRPEPLIGPVYDGKNVNLICFDVIDDAVRAFQDLTNLADTELRNHAT
jgi:hypothetical protein